MSGSKKDPSYKSAEVGTAATLARLLAEAQARLSVFTVNMDVPEIERARVDIATCERQLAALRSAPRRYETHPWRERTAEAARAAELKRR